MQDLMRPLGFYWIGIINQILHNGSIGNPGGFFDGLGNIEIVQDPR
jgi:hypothetical protein